ncbi:MAG: hypothetical protein WCO00_04260 [Rhodospirillaceae bacterium]
MGVRWVAVLMVLAGAGSSVWAAGGASPEGWRQFRFGMSPEAALAELGSAGEAHGDAIRTAVDIEGESYTVLMSFRAGRLHDVFLKSSIGRARAGTDAQCLAFHRGVVGRLAESYGRDGETEHSAVGEGVRTLFTRTRLVFADGRRVIAETKFVPSLGGNGLCDSSLSYLDAN